MPIRYGCVLPQFRSSFSPILLDLCQPKQAGREGLVCRELEVSKAILFTKVLGEDWTRSAMIYACRYVAATKRAQDSSLSLTYSCHQTRPTCQPMGSVGDLHVMAKVWHGKHVAKVKLLSEHGTQGKVSVSIFRFPIRVSSSSQAERTSQIHKIHRMLSTLLLILYFK